MVQKRSTYTKEFKLEAVQLSLREGATTKDVAFSLGIHPANLSRWRKEYFLDQEGSFPGRGNMKESEQELHRLRREVVQLREEREILKKALVFFSKESK